MPPISFNDIPSDSRVPFTYVEFDSSKSQQGPSLQPFELLVIGQKMAAGSVAELVPTGVTSADQAGLFFGRGSMLHAMAVRLFENNKLTKATFVAQDDAAGTAATGTVTFTGTSTAAGTIFLYVAGRRIAVPIASGEDATAVATAVTVAAALAANDDLQASIANTLGVATATAKNLGTAGDSIDLRLNYFSGEELPAGITAAIVAMTGGATDPSISAALAVLGEAHRNVLAIGYPANQTANYVALDAELADRFGPLRAIEAIAFLGESDSHANLITLGSGLNSKSISVMGVAGAPNPPWEWAAANAGVVAEHGKNDPARPFQTLQLKGLRAPAEAAQFTLAERDLLLRDGISVYVVDAAGAVRINAEITNWQVNAAGGQDTSFLFVNSGLTLGFIRHDLRTQFAQKFPRHKIANDGTSFGAGQAIITPKLARAQILSLFRGWEQLGLVEGFDQFKAELIVERNAQDPNRMDFLLPTDLVNQFRVAGVQIQFLL